MQLNYGVLHCSRRYSWLAPKAPQGYEVYVPFSYSPLLITVNSPEHLINARAEVEVVISIRFSRIIITLAIL